MTNPNCWCPTPNLISFNNDYLRCQSCQTLICRSQPESPAAFYGRDYWTTRQTNTLGHPDIYHRARQDLNDRAIYWLKTLLKYKRPPGKTLELGSGHGGFSALLKWAGFQAAGLEPHAWVSQLAHTVFNIPTLTGRLADQTLEPRSLDIIILLDVLEHLPDPVETLHLCSALLKADGMLMIQTPCAPPDKTFETLETGENPFLKMLLPLEHLYLYSKQGIEQLLHQTGFQYLTYEKALFPYDMFLIAAADSLPEPLNTEPADSLEQLPSGRLVLALMDVHQKWREADASLNEKQQQIQQLGDYLQEVEADRSARLEKIQDLNRRLETAESDRNARLQQIQILSQKLQEVEADRTNRWIQIEELTSQLSEVELESANRMNQIEELTGWLKTAEADRQSLHSQVTELTSLHKQSETDRAARLEQINELTEKLQLSDADRNARLDQIKELTTLLQASEADRAERLQQIETLTGIIRDYQSQTEDPAPPSTP